MSFLSTVVSRWFLVVTVRGASMEPTFAHGDRVLARRRGPVTVGAVVVVAPPGDERLVIKRVAAVPGDPVPRLPALADAPERVVPPGKLVLLGDNAPLSEDSRRLGYFALDRVRGVVARTLPGRAEATPRLTVHRSE